MAVFALAMRLVSWTSQHVLVFVTLATRRRVRAFGVVRFVAAYTLGVPFLEESACGDVGFFPAVTRLAGLPRIARTRVLMLMAGRTSADDIPDLRDVRRAHLFVAPVARRGFGARVFVGLVAREALLVAVYGDGG